MTCVSFRKRFCIIQLWGRHTDRPLRYCNSSYGCRSCNRSYFLLFVFDCLDGYKANTGNHNHNRRDAPGLQCAQNELSPLELSFLGWMLLGMVTLGIAYIWVYPYMCATMTNAYESLKPVVEVPSANAEVTAAEPVAEENQ